MTTKEDTPIPVLEFGLISDDLKLAKSKNWVD